MYCCSQHQSTRYRKPSNISTTEHKYWIHLNTVSYTLKQQPDMRSWDTIKCSKCFGTLHWPWSLLPKQCSLPSAVMAQVWKSPAATNLSISGDNTDENHDEHDWKCTRSIKISCMRLRCMSPALLSGSASQFNALVSYFSSSLETIPNVHGCDESFRGHNDVCYLGSAGHQQYAKKSFK